MKKLLLLATLLVAHLSSQATPTLPTAADSAARQKAVVDSINATFHYQTGLVKLPESLGDLTVPRGFRYLDADQSKRLLTQIWGNPDGESLGMLFPADRGPLSDNNWAFVLQYEGMGYVKDDDAADINYDDLLKEMQEDTEESNKERIEAGYEPVMLVGWAAKPYYDKGLNVLHWAKELRFGREEISTLNYNVRLLGRKGVLNLNAVGTPSQLPEIKSTIPAVIQSVAFAKGLRYADFNPDLDDVAAYGIGGLVAGKVLAKVGFFALVLKFWKVLLALVAGAWTAIRRFFGGRTPDEKGQPALEGPSPEPEA
ncbi:DUF2167 domain-containing protein [Hymenobacter pini]|uniref:DUF2167 domain-containing protein n=1 Tax=Hymenobacter pini TaxID=2880879 RepID=UPI001CF57045|nr:DUF2167 domain-containing protein [Hymenobacter pini]MCA8831484.1 DUF2167 domain-containing protein [Hymenobacter pini]